jgi:hypothetical protein
VFSAGLRVKSAVLLLLLAVASLGADTPCQPGYGKASGLYELVSEKLAAIPSLKVMMLEMAEDPAIPKSIKLILKKALESPNLTIHELTDEVRREYRIPEEFDASHAVTGLPFRLFSPEGQGKTLNEAATQQMSVNTGQRPRGPVKYHLFIQNRALTARDNDLVKLAHELAHVRFDQFLAKNIASLHKRLPESLVRKETDGSYSVNQQFYDFICERYAYETEFETLRATHGKYYSEWLEQFGSESAKTVPRDKVAKALSAGVIANYKITDPEVLKLKDRTLASIIKGP